MANTYTQLFIHVIFVVKGRQNLIHLLIGLEPQESLSSLVKEIKRCSSLFINDKKLVKGKFEWQSGFAAFTYSKSQIPTVCRYIENQEIHPKQKTFREEYVDMLRKFEVKYDEKYLFDEVTDM